ncbi:MAG: hypothetical protein A4S17_09890 [Proteobacteria bacterium HN_bin10]|nr:MAG: hypothetical protein A4S17_09890 [Proteobacteria bacterium HN_bin10]
MLTCFALVATLGAAGMADIPRLATEIETEARALASTTELTPALTAQIEDFSNDAARFSNLLYLAGADQDVSCIFHDIAKEARDHAGAFAVATTPAARADAFFALRPVLDDAALMAPVAAMAAQESRALASR